MLTLKKINRALEQQGVQERLCYCKELGYFYFAEGESAGWFRTMVGGVSRLNQLSLEQWLDEYHTLKNS